MKSRITALFALVAGASLVLALFPSTFQSAYANRPGDEGCTPGYWKNHTPWEITVLVDGNLKVLTPTTLVRDAFDVDFLDDDYDDDTLLDALNYKGNGGPQNQLLRHGVAALLNSSEIPTPIIDFSLTDDQVYDRVRDGLDNQYVVDLAEFANDDDTESWKDFLEAANEDEGGCPLN